MLKEDHLQEKYYVMLHFVMLKMITSKKRYHVVLQYNIMSKMITFKKYIMLCYIISPWRWSPSRKKKCYLTLCSVEDDHLQEKYYVTLHYVLLKMITFKKDVMLCWRWSSLRRNPPLLRPFCDAISCGEHKICRWKKKNWFPTCHSFSQVSEILNCTCVV